MVKKMHSSSNGSTAGTTAGKSGKARKSGNDASASAFSGLQNSALASSVKDSAQQIWLAGMGAFSKAQEEGSKVFEALVKEGQSLQRKTQAVAEEKIGDVTSKMTAMAGTVTSKAGQNWDKLETIFEARTAKAMNTLGVPTAKDVAALTQRVDALAAAVAKLSRSAPKSDAPTQTRTTRMTRTAHTTHTTQKAPKAAAKRATKAAAGVAKPAAKRARKTAASSTAA
jgi:poly(hydroxyalkanoate) granule-associated protein